MYFTRAFYYNRACPTGETYQELPTRLVDEDDEYHYFEADTPGFSTFVIGTSAPIFETTDQRLIGFDDTTGVVDAAATVENVGSVAGTIDITLSADGTAIAATELTVPAGETRDVAVSGTVDGTGPMSLTLDDQLLDDVELIGPETQTSETLPASAAPTDDTGTGLSALVVLAGLLAVAFSIIFLWRRRSADDETDEHSDTSATDPEASGTDDEAEAAGMDDETETVRTDDEVKTTSIDDEAE